MSRRRRSEGGFMAAEFALGLLLVVPIGCVAMAMPGWPERQSVARLAASEAARAAVAADTWSDAVTAGRATAAEVAANYGVDPDDVSVELEGSVARGERVTATRRHPHARPRPAPPHFGRGVDVDS